MIGLVAAAWCAPGSAAAAVGPGKLTVAPSTAAAGSAGNTFAFTYATPSTQNVTGVLLVSAPQGFTTPQIRNPALPGFVAVLGGSCPAAVLGTAGQAIAIGLACRSGTSFGFTYAGRGSKVTVPPKPGQYAFETSIFLVSHPLAQLPLPSPLVNVVDRTPPVVSISGVSDGQVSNAAALTPVFSATDDDLASVTAILDGAPFVSGTPVTGEGAHILVVSASDRAGNRSTLTAHFTLDRTPPAISINGVTDGEISNAPISPSYTATDPNLASLSATLDGAPLTSGTTVAADGAHVLVVSAADLAGNTATASVHFRIDSTPPALSIRAPADGAVLNTRSVTVVATARDAGGLVSVTANGVPLSLASDGSSTGLVTLAEGPNSIIVIATDNAGNRTSQSVNVVVDTQAPQLTVDSPADGAHIPALATTVSGSVHDTSPVVLAVGGVPVTLAADGSFSTTVPLHLGTNAVVIVATDAAGNATSVTRGVHANDIPPTLSISAPADGLSTAATSVTVTGSVQPGDPTDTIPVSVNVNGLPALIAADNSFSAVVALTSGINPIHVVATDGYGLQAGAVLTVTQDAAPPVISISGVSDGQVSNAAALTPVFSATDDDLASVTAILDGAPFVSSTPVTGEGAHVLVVNAADLAGNTATASVHFTIDTTPPTLSTSSPPDGARLSELRAAVTGTVHDTSPVVLTISGAATPVAADGSFSTTVPLVQGGQTIVIVATDAAGNSTTVSRSVRANAIPPALSISSPPDGLTTQSASVKVSGSVLPGDPSDTVSVTVAGVAAAVAADGTFSATVALAPGANAIHIVATDGYGLQATANLTIIRS